MSECKNCVVYLPFGNINKTVWVYPLTESIVDTLSKYENAYLLCKDIKVQRKLWEERFKDKSKLTRDMLYSTQEDYILDELVELEGVNVEDIDFDKKKELKDFLKKMEKLVKEDK